MHLILAKMLTKWNKILDHNAMEQNATLPKLPQEMILSIIEGLSWADTVSLGLSCKQLGTKTQYARMSFAKIEEDKKSARAGAKTAHTVAAKKYSTLAQHLPGRVRKADKQYTRNGNRTLAASNKFVRLDLLRQIHDFFPKKCYRLCYGCIKYRPWTSGGGAWGGDRAYENSVYKSQAAHARGPRCQYCLKRELLQMNATKAEMDRLKKMVAGI
jgi:hypothetical protein